MVKIHLKSWWTAGGKYLPQMLSGGPVTVEVKPRATVEDLMAELGMSNDEVTVVFINGEQRNLDYTLQPGDEVSLFGPAAGG